MVQFLKIYGDDDFAVVTWEKGPLSIQETVEKVKANGSPWEFEEGCYAELVEFNFTPDSKAAIEDFIAWVKDTIGDYDSLKNTDFFIV